MENTKLIQISNLAQVATTKSSIREVQSALFCCGVTFRTCHAPASGYSVATKLLCSNVQSTPFCNWRWPITKTDSTQEQNSAPHPAVGAERLANERNNSAKFGFSSSFSITSTFSVKNGISSKQFGIHSKRFDKVSPTFEPI